MGIVAPSWQDRIQDTLIPSFTSLHLLGLLVIFILSFAVSMALTKKKVAVSLVISVFLTLVVATGFIFVVLSQPSNIRY